VSPVPTWNRLTVRMPRQEKSVGGRRSSPAPVPERHHDRNVSSDDPWAIAVTSTAFSARGRDAPPPQMPTPVLMVFSPTTATMLRSYLSPAP